MIQMVGEILWSDSAKITFDKIIAYLKENWTDKEADSFIGLVENFLQRLLFQPEMCRPSLKRKNVRIGILNKHTQIIYHYKPGTEQIEILLFWNFKQNSEKLRY